MNGNMQYFNLVILSIIIMPSLHFAQIALVVLLLHRKHRIRHRLSNLCLPPISQSAWNQLWTSKDDPGMIHMTGFDVFSFRIIHHAIAPHLYTNHHHRGGRPSRLDTYATTALGLYYLHTTIPIKGLCQIFASPLSTTQRALLRALYAIAKHVPHIHEARIQWPSKVNSTKHNTMQCRLLLMMVFKFTC